mgnify:CR=1 FL=1
MNLAAVAGPIVGIADALMDVNYRAPVAAAMACEQLGFGHWIQSSTQATNAERAGQVSCSSEVSDHIHGNCFIAHFLLVLKC